MGSCFEWRGSDKSGAFVVGGQRRTFFYQRNHKFAWTVGHVHGKVVRMCNNMIYFVLLCNLLRIAVIYWLTIIRSIITTTALCNRSTFVNNNISNNVTQCGSNCMTIWEESRTQRSECISMIHCAYTSYPFKIYFSVLHKMYIYNTAVIFPSRYR